MSAKNKIYRLIPIVTATAAAILFVLSFILEQKGDTAETIAQNAGKKVEERIEILEEHVNDLLSDPDQHSCLKDLPEDMVIYKYVNDSLVSWSNQFTLLNDDISSRLVFQRLTNLKSRLVSPLVNVTPDYSYMNLGPKWYVVRSIVGKNNEKIIAGIEINNSLIDNIRRNDNGVYRHLSIPGQYTVLPLNYSGGTPVTVNGTSMFKVLADSTATTPSDSTSGLKWLAAFLLVISAVTYLGQHRTIKAYMIASATITVVFITTYIWGINQGDDTELFSPNIYADGPLFFSLGALLLINAFITIISFCIYLMRNTFTDMLRRSGNPRKILFSIYSIVLSGSIIGIIVYTHTTLRSLLQNSNISLELYRQDIDLVSNISVYISYVGLLFCILFFLHMLASAIREFTGRRIHILSKKSLAIFALSASAYLSLTVGIHSINREQEKSVVWANRLAVERDLGLEIRLRATENDIANDPIISALSTLDGAEVMILNRISENFLSRIRQNYSLNLVILDDNNPGLVKYYTNILGAGVPIQDGSRFYFISDGLGSSRYVGMFIYYSQVKGLMRMFLEIEPTSNIENGGYNRILRQFSSPDGINIPSFYSYAKYSKGVLTSYKGNYPYPIISEKFEIEPDKQSEISRFDDFTHFIRRVSDSEIIVISRPQTSIVIFFTSLSYSFLILLGLMMIFFRGSRRNTKNNFFRTRINIILFISSSMILASMTIVSIVFVYKRHGEVSNNMMSSRISTIQALIERHAKNAQNYTELMAPGFKAAIEDISKTTKSDISLYTPDGKVFYSSRPEVFDKMILGNRIDREAFHNIIHQHQRFFINEERIAGFHYNVLYAPIINNNNDIIAIASVPYTGLNDDFQREAFIHAALLINIFLLLLIISLLFSTKEVNELFTPLMEMGKKMSNSDIHNLQPIVYKKEDEISSLVDAYNRMVKELADSTVRLAQAERDKAWSQMARQVAHEIKNPLTPIKLEIQRLIRLKNNGNPKWEERFDQVSAVVLEHIDILTETANEFSTFAKLYSEEPVLMDLDRTIKEQILIFDNKQNISIEYIGLENALVTAPRPQLIRVFVNLITNAIQAVEIKQKEMVESGESEFHGKVSIALRNGVKDGYYDIAVDDNGDGVKDENLEKLFTPNFTTKSGGTGLGLAICRNIIEKCEGSITYNKSFLLGGASFTVSLPKKKDTDAGV